MKKLILFFCICAFFSCKKKDAISNNTLPNKKWVLETAVVTPALTINGVTSTDYKNLYGPGSCLASNYTLVFNEDGSYGFGSNGSLCDMLAASKEDKWTRDGSTIVLKNRFGKEIVASTNGDIITYTEANTPGVVYWEVLYTFKAK